MKRWRVDDWSSRGRDPIPPASGLTIMEDVGQDVGLQLREKQCYSDESGATRNTNAQFDSFLIYLCRIEYHHRLQQIDRP